MIRIRAEIVDDQLVIGALVRGTLTARDVEDWRPFAGASRVERAFEELHGELLDACLVSLEVHGRVRLDRILNALGPVAGESRGGRLRGYLPDLARRAPTRQRALLALDRRAYALGRDQEARRAVVGVVLGVATALEARGWRGAPLRDVALGVCADLAEARASAGGR